MHERGTFEHFRNDNDFLGAGHQNSWDEIYNQQHINNQYRRNFVSPETPQGYVTWAGIIWFTTLALGVACLVCALLT